MDAPPDQIDLHALVARMRRRQVSVSRAELAQAQLSAKQYLYPNVMRDWLAGCWHLSRYEHLEAFEILQRACLAAAQAHDESELIVPHDGSMAAAVIDMVELHNLAFDVRDAFIDACVILGDFATAYREARVLVDSSRASGDRQRVARALTWLGTAQFHTGGYHEAIGSLSRAVEEFGRAGASGETARALNGLGIIHRENGDLARACPLFESALAAALRAGDRDMEGRALANWGDALVADGRLDDAFDKLQRAIVVLEEIGAFWNSAWCELALGRALTQQGKMDEALAMHKRALVSVRKCKSPRTEVEVLAGLGELHGKMGHYDLARMQLEYALATATRSGIEREIFKTHQSLAALHKQFGNYERALHHHEQFHAMRTKVFDELVNAKLARVIDESAFERTRRGHELSQLRNVELARALEQVEHLNHELTEKAQELEYASNRDVMTGLYNRRYLYSRMTEEVCRADRHGSRLSMVLYDVDHFKLVNDQHSHAVGDDVLRALARLISAALRQSDVHVRYGGEEFAVMMPETTVEQARLVVEKLRALVAGYDWAQIAPGLTLTISAGVVAMKAGESMAGVLRRVDAKLYEAKRGGRNQVQVG